MPVIHIATMNVAEAHSWNVARNQGAGNTFRQLLFKMLKMMLKTYQPATYVPTLRVVGLTAAALTTGAGLETPDAVARGWKRVPFARWHVLIARMASERSSPEN